MVYEIKFGWGFYEGKRNLNEILESITQEEINRFQNFVMKSFRQFYIELKEGSIQFDKAQLKMDKGLGLKSEEEYQRELKKIEERKNKLEEEVERYLESNLKLEFHSRYSTLLTYSIEVITRTGWLLYDFSSFNENEKMKGEKLIYTGKNFTYYGKDSPLIKV